jgi:hypothetical protein
VLALGNEYGVFFVFEDRKTLTVPCNFRRKALQTCPLASNHNSYPQQLVSSLPLQPQEGSPPVIMLLMSAAAHPTPLSTLSAPNAQLFTQAPHSMHLSLSRITAFFPSRAKTS